MTDELKTLLLEVDYGVSLLLWEKETSVNVNCLSGYTYLFALKSICALPTETLRYAEQT